MLGKTIFPLFRENKRRKEEGKEEEQKKGWLWLFYALDKIAIWDFSILSSPYRIVDLNFSSKWHSNLVAIDILELLSGYCFMLGSVTG